MDREKSLRVKTIFKLLLSVLALAVSIQFFQNCSALMAPQDDTKSYKSIVSGSATPADHPSEAVIQPTQQQPVIANRIYIAELLSEVFETSTTSKSTASISSAWVGNYSGIFGYPCNPSGKNGTSDCGGTTLAPMNPKPDTLRASHKAQLCLSLTSQDSFLQAALSKIENLPSAPDGASIDQLLKLFYRGDEELSVLVSHLVSIDRQIKTDDPNIADIDRWRLLTNMVCESPGWELL